MTDLDARVAALMRKAAYLRYAPIEVADKKIMEFEQALRAELQKPALHEPCTIGEASRALTVFAEPDDSALVGMQAAINSVLQGRAKPASRIPFAGYDPNFVPGSDPNNPQEEQPAQETIPPEYENYSRFLDAQMAEIAQEEITDEQLWKIWKELPVILGGSFKENFIAFARACIRASKGEK